MTVTRAAHIVRDILPHMCVHMSVRRLTKVYICNPLATTVLSEAVYDDHALAAGSRTLMADDFSLCLYVDTMRTMLARKFSGIYSHKSRQAAHARAWREIHILFGDRTTARGWWKKRLMRYGFLRMFHIVNMGGTQRESVIMLT